MAEILSAPLGWSRELILPSLKPLLMGTRISRYAILVGSPGARVTPEKEGCQLRLRLSAAASKLDLASRVEGWGQPEGGQGAVDGTFIRRNSCHIIGQERVDGTVI